MIDAYDRDGMPIDFTTMGRLLTDAAYKIIEQTHVGLYLVSTVWLGIDHSYSRSGPPIIFETMVFPADDDVPIFSELDCRRYATEAEAREGHEATVLLVRATTQLDDRKGR